MVKLFLTNSYFNTFPLLINQLAPTKDDIDAKKIIFCEDAISLMTERAICNSFNGTLNTQVNSFGNYLYLKKPTTNVLSMEGSAMVTKKVLTTVNLNCFNQSKIDCASTLYDVINKLKSSSITPDDLLACAENTHGVLKDKLFDIAKVYDAYEKYLIENKLIDQNTAFTFLPDIVKNDEELENTDVYIVGFTSISENAKKVIAELIKKSKSVTAILTSGLNPYVYLNEAEKGFLDVCQSLNEKVIITRDNDGLNKESKIVLDNIFSPKSVNLSKTESNKIYTYSASSIYDEASKVANVIKQKAMKENCRYRDFTIAIPDAQIYQDAITEAFRNQGVAYFLDLKKKPLNHPLIQIILSFIEVKRLGLNRRLFCDILKNPLFSEDKIFNDKLENLLLKNNINYNRLETPFTFDCEREELEKYESARIKIVETFSKKTNGYLVKEIYEMLDKLDVENKLTSFSSMLFELDEVEEKAVNDQIYKAVIGVLDQIDKILFNVKFSVKDFKNIFLSGINALEISIIPQYNDAVFIGEYKKAGILKANYLFAMGLTSAFPTYSEDTGVLTDREIDLLENLKIKIEPKIKVVNRRKVEGAVMGVCAFREQLYLSYYYADEGGKTYTKSEILNFFERAFTTKPFPETQDYLYKMEGLKTFSLECGKVADRRQPDQTGLSSFVRAIDIVDSEKERKEESDYFILDSVKDDIDYILSEHYKEQKIELKGNREILVKNLASPTGLENYFNCPYKFFLTHGLGLKERDMGEVDFIQVGLISHAIFSEYVKKIERVKDKESSNNLFEEISNELLSSAEYKRYLLSPQSKFSINSLLNANKKLCFDIFNQLDKSQFKPDKANIEVRFNDKGAVYPAVSLRGGKVKIAGTIDRVDTYNQDGKEFCRIIDYKTGSIDTGDESLFAGIKLQLYLYASSVRGRKEEEKENKRQIVGVYYLQASDEFTKEGASSVMMKGKTLKDQALTEKQDATFIDGKSEYLGIRKTTKNEFYKDAKLLEKQELDKYIDYAVKVSDKAVENLENGFIAPSPYEKACEYCNYKGICKSAVDKGRTIGKVDKDVIVNATIDTDKA